MADVAVGCRGVDGFLTAGISAWKQEVGDTGRASVTIPKIVSGKRELISVFEPDPVCFPVTKLKMATNGTDEPVHTAGERTGGLRPLKSRPEDRIASIMDNPFYKSFGVRHPRSPRDVASAPASPRTNSASTDSDGKYAVREDLGDYRPGSGFVHKLMGRFASMELREEASIPRMKNASSVEDILDRKEPHAVAADASAGERHHRERSRLMSSFAQNRARSVESVGRRKGALNIPVVLRHVERSEDHHHPTSYLKSPRESHIVAPDVKLGRDDIILIENPPSSANSVSEDAEAEEEARVAAHPSGYGSEKSKDELPKPNTVSAVRSLFESGKPLSPTGLNDDVFTPRESVLTPRDQVLTPRDQVLTPRDYGVSQRKSSLSSSSTSNLTPRDSVLTPASTSRDSSSSFHSDSLFSPREPLVSPRDVRSGIGKLQSPHLSDSTAAAGVQVKSHDTSRGSRFSWSSATTGGAESAATTAAPTTSTPPPLPSTHPPVSPVTSPTAEFAADSSSEFCGSAKPSSSSSSSMFQNSVAVGGPPASPRSTAAVKAIPVSRSSIPSPRPSATTTSTSSVSGSSVPPSFTPNIKKTSPVMPVAPFKETTKTDEGGGDNRFLIYSKKSSGTSKQPKEARLKDYGEGSDDSGSSTRTAQDKVKQHTPHQLQAAEDVKKLDNNSGGSSGGVKKSNKVNGTHNKGQAPAVPVPKQRRALGGEERSVTSRMGGSGGGGGGLGGADYNSSSSTWVDLKPSPRIEDSQPPVMLSPVETSKPVKSPRTTFSSSSSSFSSKAEEEEEKNADSITTTTSLFSSSSSYSSGEKKEPQSLAPVSMMDTDDAVSNEDGKGEDPSSQPIKGIPSIIAKRLQQSSQGGGPGDQPRDADDSEKRRPGELFGVRLGKTPHGHNTTTLEEEEDESEIPRKRLTPTPTLKTGKESASSSSSSSSSNSGLPNEIENQIASVRRRMEEQANRSKHSGVSQIFDSSQLHKKKKKAASTTPAGVPKLDLSSITSEDTSNAGSSGGYRVTPREIKPCKIEFIGANVSLGKSLLKKSRKEKAI